MAAERIYSIWFTLANIARFLFWLLLVAIVIVVVFSRSADPQVARNQLLEQFQAERKSRVIAMIHRQESASVLGVPVSSHIDIEDSEAILRAIRLTPPEQPIDLILHTPGGLVLAAEQIAKALAERKAKVTVFIPHYAMSGGTLIALAADEIVMDANAVLGPVDPQIGDAPAASILRVLELKKPEDIDDATIILADIAQKARVQVATFVAQVLSKHFPADRATKLAVALSEGRWTHDFPIPVQMARELGLPVTTNMPLMVYQLMDLYPQANAQRPSVVYVPTPLATEKAKGPAPIPAAPAPK
ncbi:MAG TPA: ATP-dependent Clp protease proteolytic subunit [Burkholderiales bacterium]|jgi:ClpP class serine protease|nr:ATP-dependent Clp protease proteolytic subunit [Burkholderiales bacterium]